MKGNKAKVRAEERRELEQSIHLVKAPLALQKDRSLTLPQTIQQQKAENSMDLDQSISLVQPPSSKKSAPRKIKLMQQEKSEEIANE